MRKSLVFGGTSTDLLASFSQSDDNQSWCWKTSQTSFEWADPTLLEVLPQSGMTSSGRLYQFFAQCGAPHLRRRWFAVAYPSTIGYHMRNAMAFGELVDGRWTTPNPNQVGSRTSNTVQSRRSSTHVHDTAGDATNTNSIGRRSSSHPEREHQHRVHRQGDTTQGEQQRCEWQSGLGKDSHASGQRIQQNYWERFPTQSPVRRRNDGVSHRVDRLRALENAVVPQCAEWVGQQIVKSGVLKCLQNN